MTANDAARHALYSQLEQVLGSAHADTLMTYLPRDRIDEVATKDDVASLATRFDRLEARFDRVESRFDALQLLIVDQQKFYTRNTVWSMVGLTAIFSLVVAFFG